MNSIQLKYSSTCQQLISLGKIIRYLNAAGINYSPLTLSTVKNLEPSLNRQQLLVDVKTKSISRKGDVLESLITEIDAGYIISLVIFNQPVSHLLSSKDKSPISSTSTLSSKMTPFSLNASGIVFSVSNTSKVSTLTPISTASNTLSVASLILESSDEPFKFLPIKPVTQSQSKVNHISLQSPSHYMAKAELETEKSTATLLSFFSFTNSLEPFKLKTYTDAVNTLLPHQKQ